MHRFFLLGNFHSVQVGNLALDGFYGLVLVDTADMEVYHDATPRLHKVGKHMVIEFRHKDLQKGYGVHLFLNSECTACSKMVSRFVCMGMALFWKTGPVYGFISFALPHWAGLYFMPWQYFFARGIVPFLQQR